MTGGRVVLLGRSGRNFAAGMSGGLAFVYDADQVFYGRCNRQLVSLENMTLENEFTPWLYDIIRSFFDETGSQVGCPVLTYFQLLPSPTSVRSHSFTVLRTHRYYSNWLDARDTFRASNTIHNSEINNVRFFQ